MEKVLSLFLLVFLLPAGSAQQCFTEDSCSGSSQTVSSVEECCLGDGISYDDGAGCMTCIVFGWLDGLRGIGPEDSVEQGQAITLEVGYLKGDDARGLNLRYDVMNIPGTAEFGANNDYTISNTQNLRPRPNRPVGVLLTLRVDNIALEGNETLSLRLINQTAASSVRPGVTEFFLDTLNVTIIDQDIVGIQFTESDYRAREEEEAIRVVVERDTRIARPVTVRIVPLNYSEFEELLNSGVIMRPDDFPFSADDPSPEPVLQAKSVPEERRDFSVTPIEVTFGVDEFPSADIEQLIDISNDIINEADEVFVVILELVDTELSAEVDLEERGASLCRIVDNDPIRIGFEQPTYTVPEVFVRPFVDLIYIIKEDDRISEQNFELGIQAGAPAQGVASAATRDLDYTIFSPTGFIQQTFSPDEQRILFEFTPLPDDIPESREAFQVSVGSTQQSAPFVNGQFPVTIVFIEDDDDVIIGFEQTSVTVPEDVGTFALCLNVSTEDLPDGLLPGGFNVLIDLNTTAGTAGPADYISVVFGIDELQFTNETLGQCFTVTIIDDLLFETLETFNITAIPFDPDDPVVIMPPTVTITILDNDQVRIGFLETEHTVNESVGSVALPVVILDGMLETSVEVTFATSGISASSPADFIQLDSTLTFDESTTMNVVNVVIVNDSLPEPPETFQASLTLLSPMTSNVVIQPAVATVTILDDDPILCPNPPPLENGMVTFTGNSIGDTATYTCNSGFELIGSATATCGLVSGNVNVAVFSPAPPVCRPLCPDPPPLLNGMVTFTGNSIGDTATYTCNSFFELFGSATATCGLVSGNVNAAEFSPAPPECRPTSPDILVNDTIIGDPLFTVPLNVRNLSADISSERVSLCYEVHGAAGEYFNLVSDSCVSVNAHYAAVDLHFEVNIIDAITVRAVGSTGQCRNITVNLAGCSTSVNGVDINMTYRSGDIYVRQYPHRVRISVPNCADQSLVMWVFCLNGTLEDPQNDSTYQVEMIRFVIARGFNLDETSHGLLGQFWNIPIDVRPYIGNLSDGTEAVDVFIVTVNYPNQEPRMFAGNLYPLTWEFEDRPCLYAGNGQGGPIDEVPDPNDPVVQGIYSDYQVNGPFETNFTFSHFDATRCT